MSIETRLRAAVELHQRGRIAEALERYTEILAGAPDNVHALNFAGAACAELGRIPASIEMLERATRLAPDYPQAFANLGVAYRCAGRFEDAARAQSKVVALLPEHAEAWNELGIAERRLGRYVKAMEAYRRAIELNPQRAEAHANLGNVLQDLDRMEDALLAYQQALGLQPDVPSVQRGLGNALQRLGRAADAAVAYREALRLEPGYVPAIIDLGGALVETGRAEEGVHWLTRARALAPDDPIVLSNLGAALHVIGRHEDAMEAFQSALELDPGNTHALSYMLITLHELGRHEAWQHLVGFDALVRRMRLELPAGHTDRGALNRMLSDYARAHPSVRGGRRPGISSELFLDGDGPPVVLREMIRSGVERYIAELPRGSAHPFVDRAPERFILSGWCNVLHEGADAHVHPNAWLSGVYYARSAGVVGDGASDPSGCLEVGPPDGALYRVEGYPRRIFVPEEGEMVVFPSYVWHRILPFEGRGERISYAFDVIPIA